MPKVRQEANIAVDERSRHELYRKLEEVLGPDPASTMMAHLPPVGWADVATKHDLAALEERLDLRFQVVDERFTSLEQRLDERFKATDWRFEGLEERFKATSFELRASFEHELRSQTLTIMFGMISIVLTMAALAFALVKFT